MNDLGFVWDVQEAQWLDQYEALKQYKEDHGHFIVPFRNDEFKKLSYWVTRQRKDWKQKKNGKKSALTDERIAKLNELGFVWNPRKRSDV